MRITRHEAVSRIRSLGLKLYYSFEYEEWQVRVPGKPEATYFTNDLQDALDTAKAMSVSLNTR